MIEKLLRATLIVAVYIVLLLTFNFLHFRLLPVSVVLYAGIADAVAALAATAALYAVLFRSRPVLGAFEGLLLAAVCVLGGYAFAISVPAVVDRSLSIYILEKIAQRGGGIREDAFGRVFIEEYLPEHRLVDVRLTEQIASGTVEIVDGCVMLTPRGERIVGWSRWYRTTMLPKRRILMGEMTDDLTDPFRRSRSDVDYLCAP